MDSKFYVSLEAAKLLKEKGYNEATDYIIDEDNCMLDSHYMLNEDLPEYICSCSTKAEAIDWLESKGIMIDIHWIRFNENRRWSYSIFNSTCDIIDSKYIYPTRLEAEEAAIIKALELYERSK